MLYNFIGDIVNLYEYEDKLYKEGIKYIAGVDEVGRGPLNGPVVSACVVLPEGFIPDGLNDSKKLSEKKRNEFYKIINDNALGIGIGIVSPEEIDEINIYEASKKSNRCDEIRFRYTKYIYYKRRCEKYFYCSSVCYSKGN